MLSECLAELEKEREFKIAAIAYIQLFTIYRTKNDDNAVDSALEHAVKNFSDDGDALRAGVSYSQWGHYYFMQGKYEKALQYNKKAVETIEKTDHMDFYARFLILEANTLSALGRNEEGIELLDKALTLPVDVALIAQVLTVKGDILFAMSRCEDSISEYEKAMALYDKKAMMKEKAEVLLKLHSSNLELGNIDKCRTHLNNAITLYSSLKDPAGESQVRMKLADLLFTSGDTKAAKDQYSQALSLVKNGKSPADEAGCIIGLGMIEYYTGNYKKAESLLTGAQDLLKKTDPQLTLTDSVYILNSLGTLSFHQGDYRKSEKLYQDALTLSRSGGFSGGEITALESLASLALQEGKAEKAMSLLRDSLKTAQQSASTGQVALIHASLGTICESLGRSEEAGKFYQASLAINEKTGFKKGMASDYINLGYFAYFYEGNTEKAEDCYKKSLSIYEEINDYYGVITVLDLLGSLYKERGDKNKAFEHFNRALDVAHTHGYMVEEQDVKYRLGYYKLLLGDIKNGYSDMEQCADFFRKSGVIPNLADLLYYLGSISLVNLGDNVKAEKQMKEARALYEQMGNRKGLLQCSLLEASIAADRDHYDEAQKILYSLLTETKPYHDLYIKCLTQFALLYENKLNRYERSLSYLEEAIKSCDEFGDIIQSNFYTLQAARMYIARSRNSRTLLKKAEELLSKAESRSHTLKIKNDEINIVYLKGKLYFEKGDYQKALDAFREACRKSEDNPNQAICALRGIISCHINMGNDKEFRNTEKEIYSYITKKRLTNRRYISEILRILVEACLLNKDYKGAERYISEKIEFDTKYNFGILLGSDYALAGYVAEIQRDKEKALSFYEKSIKCADQYLGKAKTEETRLETSDFNIINQEAFRAYGGAIRLLLEKGRYAEALDYSERNRARTFVNTVGSRAWPPPSKVNEKIIENIKNLREFTGLLSAMTEGQTDAPLVAMESIPSATVRGSTPGGTGPINSSEMKRFRAFNDSKNANTYIDIPADYIEQYKAKYLEILPLLKMENKEYYGLKSSTPATPVSDIQKMLDNDTVMLEYFIDEKDSYLFVITSGAISTFTTHDENLAQDLNEKIGILRSGIQDDINSTDVSTAVKSAASELYHLLIEPAEQLIAGKKRLVIVPHRNLHYLPFAALMNREGKPLISAHSVVYLPSAATLAICREKSKARKTGKEPFLAGFALGDPADSEGLGALPGSKAELMSIEKFFKNKEVAVEREFTGQKIISLSPEADYLHFATHGVLDETNPYCSGLATSNELFRVENIFNMPSLNKCTLATMSACKTALGRIYGGDDIVGLSRAFLYAGAPSVTSSLWSVSDESTALLMSCFYENLSRGMSKDEALQKAQLRLMEKYPQPFHWAPFILIGDWEVCR
ncbi:MAG: CHAT domain-containing protein [Candidatus Xenobiia bacterium LiM19]